jgi:hypothetical protein
MRGGQVISELEPRRARPASSAALNHRRRRVMERAARGAAAAAASTATTTSATGRGPDVPPPRPLLPPSSLIGGPSLPREGVVLGWAPWVGTDALGCGLGPTPLSGGTEYAGQDAVAWPFCSDELMGARPESQPARPLEVQPGHACASLVFTSQRSSPVGCPGVPPRPRGTECPAKPGHHGHRERKLLAVAALGLQRKLSSPAAPCGCGTSSE